MVDLAVTPGNGELPQNLGKMDFIRGPSSSQEDKWGTSFRIEIVETAPRRKLCLSGRNGWDQPLRIRSEKDATSVVCWNMPRNPQAKIQLPKQVGERFCVPVKTRGEMLPNEPVVVSSILSSMRRRHPGPVWEEARKS